MTDAINYSRKLDETGEKLEWENRQTLGKLDDEIIELCSLMGVTN